MKAAVLMEPKKIIFKEVPVPELEKGKVLIKVEAVGICGSDMHLYLDGHIGATVLDKPLVLGHEIVGTVIEVGEGVNRELLGQRVIVDPGENCGQCEHCRTGAYNLCSFSKFKGIPPVDGGMAEYITALATHVIPLPENLDSPTATLLEPFSVGLQAVDVADFRAGAKIAVLGGGPVGVLTAIAAKIRGCGDLWLTELYERRIEIARKLGIEKVINVAQEDPLKTIMEVTKKSGVDVVFETTGNPKAVEQALQIVKRGGTVVFLGIGAGKVPINIDQVTRTGLKLLGSFRYQYHFAGAVALVKKHNLDFSPLVTNIYDFVDIPKALEEVSTYKDRIMKGVIVFPQK
ncbi:zinc-dependent alcohol dehydrogenase [Carboxydothermus hydrogenoformans]|uniref:Sorbitol dehydrogenase n=1 Tax=Carboxydothermus hydrogenoformans (strain ATCC BAA-161 / DSM 6008 / Z-2901) TaxID=246194 RepID=Q3ACJ3_CARHZ|nr:alcohol dehydrogenase catalytic domain-containing protein [Carboxydothermus hydrogenoformans]ABB14675.1 sorbitol dehydrogenase [Carboxydothermus hydrogenoformans Z-2901]